jgi:peptidoglycan/LPS O-acetylase OafA/YrhL
VTLANGTAGFGGNRFVALDSLRGVCAIIVALFHFRIDSHIGALPLVRNGWLFVDFFFVLSGFVLASAYAEKLQTRAVPVGRFLLLRLGRIYPLHVAILLAMVALELVLLLVDLSAVSNRTPFEGARSLTAIGSNLTMLHSFGVHDVLTWNGPSWSIAAEMWTYVLFALVCLIAGRRSRPALIAIGIGSLVVLMIVSPHAMNTTYQYGFLRSFAGFGLGVAAHWAFTYGLRPRGTGAEIAAVLLVVAFVSLVGRGNATFAAPVLFALVVLIFASDDGPVSRQLQRAPFVLLGLISYSIYMVHAFMQARIGDVVKLFGGPYGLTLSSRRSASNEFPSEAIIANPFMGDAIIVVMIGLVCGVSMLTYRTIEHPCREWVRRSLRGMDSRT